jgi:hypothetical protein
MSTLIQTTRQLSKLYGMENCGAGRTQRKTTGAGAGFESGVLWRSGADGGSDRRRDDGARAETIS